MLTRVRVFHQMLCLTLLCAGSFSCSPGHSTGRGAVPVYHSSTLHNTPSRSLLSGFLFIAGLFKPMEWLVEWQREVLAVEAPSRRRVVRVAVLADLNGSYGSTHYKEPVYAAVAALIDTFKPSLVISTGDMVAGMKHGLDYEAMWAAFHEVVTRPLERAGLPFAPTPGNHDGTNRPGFEEEREVYASTWRAHMPALDFVDSKGYPRRYAFMHEGILFVSIDASTVGRLSRAQRMWLEGVLTKHAEIKVKVVYGHVPLHAFARGRETEVLDDERLEAMFVEYGVTMYVSGHHHAYYPGRREHGLRLVSMACLGGGPRQLLQSKVEGPGPRALAIIELDPEEGVVSVEAYTADDFSQTIERATLPESIGEGDKRIVRDDL